LGDREERPPGVGFVALSWINFGLLVAALLKFAPLILSYAHGADLSPDQIALGLGEQRAWALDLISDTPYLLAPTSYSGKRAKCACFPGDDTRS